VKGSGRSVYPYIQVGVGREVICLLSFPLLLRFRVLPFQVSPLGH
jgi:hypothetical protein